jgi:hypothetical protein
MAATEQQAEAREICLGQLPSSNSREVVNEVAMCIAHPVLFGVKKFSRNQDLTDSDLL